MCWTGCMRWVRGWGRECGRGPLRRRGGLADEGCGGRGADAAGPSEADGMRVLIVDDSSVIRRLVERSLRRSGAEVAEVIDAADGLEALAVLRQCELEGERLNLILTDIRVPGMDGFQFVEQMRAENLMAGVPVVLVTGEHCMTDVRRAMAAGVAGYLRKPFTPEQVKATVVRLTLAA